MGVLICVTVSNVKACWRSKTDLVFKTNKYLLNSTNSLDPYSISFIWLCAFSRLRTMLLEMWMCLIMILPHPLPINICVECDWY